MLTKPQAIYADLLKRSLLNIPYIDNEIRIRYLLDCLDIGERECSRKLYDETILSAIEEGPLGKNTARQIMNLAKDGRENRPFAQVMMGGQRLANLQAAVVSVLKENIQGDFLEAGTWKGGGCVLMRALLEICDVTNRIVWVADSFQGVPPASLPQDRGLELTSNDVPYIGVSLDRVKGLFERYGLLDDQVKFLPGWFKDTLPGAPVEKLAILRLDGDLYESTRDTLLALYEKVSPGGYIIIDDYYAIAACQLAVDEFRNEKSITDTIHQIDWTGIYWRKNKH